MHKEGNTPSSTPPTRTKSTFYKVPYAGAISYGDESWPIHAGVVECPLEVAEGGQWPAASPEEVIEHKKVRDKAEKSAEAQRKADEKEAEAKRKADEKEAEAKRKAEEAAAKKAAADEEAKRKAEEEAAKKAADDAAAK